MIDDMRRQELILLAAASLTGIRASVGIELDTRAVADRAELDARRTLEAVDDWCRADRIAHMERHDLAEHLCEPPADHAPDPEPDADRND